MNKDAQGKLLIVVSAAVIAALFSAVALVKSKPKAGADNCIGVPVRNTVIVLDHSEAMSAQTSNEILARALAHVNEKVQINERVSVFAINDASKTSLRPIFSACRPRDEGNRAIESTRQIKKKFQDSFEKPLLRALSTPAVEAKESPISQTLTDITLSQFLRGEQNSLLVFSDMLENTSKFSVLKCNSSTDVIGQYRASKAGTQERPTLRNTEVSVHLIPRPETSKESLKCRDKLWPWFFGDNPGGQASFAVDYLPGGATATTGAIKK